VEKVTADGLSKAGKKHSANGKLGSNRFSQMGLSAFLGPIKVLHVARLSLYIN
jgi:hypothetical protein